jgi:hypothetical protein
MHWQAPRQHALPPALPALNPDACHTAKTSHFFGAQYIKLGPPEMPKECVGYLAGGILESTARSAMCCARDASN